MVGKRGNPRFEVVVQALIMITALLCNLSSVNVDFNVFLQGGIVFLQNSVVVNQLFVVSKQPLLIDELPTPGGGRM